MRVLLAQVKWDRFKAIIARVSDKLEEEYPEGLDRKQLERDRGFAIHAMGENPTLRPYLNGTHQTLEIWWVNQDSEGWILSQAELDAHNGMTDTFDLDPSDAPPPARVRPVPRLRRDMLALRRLTRAHSPLGGAGGALGGQPSSVVSSMPLE